MGYEMKPGRQPTLGGEGHGRVLTVSKVTKRFGATAVLDGLDLTVDAGEIVGLVGRNGSGKSTLLSIISGLAAATSGGVATTGSIALLPERLSFVENLTGMANLRLLGRLNAHPTEDDLRDLLTSVGLDPALRTSVANYSLGMRQRLGIAQALMEHADLLILDEPTNGLDPEGIRWLRNLVRAQADHGAGVLISSHLLTELERSCDIVAVLDEGRIVATWTPADEAGHNAVQLVATDSEALLERCRQFGWPTRPGPDGSHVAIVDITIGEAVRRLANAGVDLEHVSRAHTSVESLLLGDQS